MREPFPSKDLDEPQRRSHGQTAEVFEAEDDDTRHYLLAPERMDLKVEKKLEDVELLRRHLHK